MYKQIQLPVIPAAPGKKVWRNEVHTTPRRITAQEKKLGPVTSLADGIHIATVSENTPPVLFEAAHLLNSVSGAERRRQCTLHEGFVPCHNYDSALVVIGGRIVGGIVADVGQQCTWRTKLSDGAKAVPAQGKLIPVVRYIWLHPDFRGQGIAQLLYQAIAGHFGCAVSELGHWLPIKRPARHVLVRMGLEEVLGFR